MAADLTMKAPLCQSLFRSLTTLQAAQRLKYFLNLKGQKRRNRTYTKFLRSPRQMQVMSGAALDFVLEPPGSRKDKLKIHVLGCSYGAEPVTIASQLTGTRPEIAFQIHARDIESAMIDRAMQGRYTPDEVCRGEFVTAEFIRRTFDRDGGDYVVKPALRARIEYGVASALDPDLKDGMGEADLVFAQNFLFHLPPAQARRAFLNICGLLAPRSVLFIDGMDTAMRVKLTRQLDLCPVEEGIEEIHNDARRDRGVHWASCYWGREPFSQRSRQWKRKFGTVFLHHRSAAATTADPPRDRISQPNAMV